MSNVQFTTVSKVERELNGRVTFDSETIPTKNDVESMISEESSWVDRVTTGKYSGASVEQKFSSRVVKEDIYLNLEHSKYTDLSVYKNVAGRKEAPEWVELDEYDEYLINNVRNSVKVLQAPYRFHGKEELFKVSYTLDYDIPEWIEGIVARRVALKIMEQSLNDSLVEGQKEVSVGDMKIVKPSDFGASLYKTIRKSVQEDESRIVDSEAFLMYGET